VCGHDSRDIPSSPLKETQEPLKAAQKKYKKLELPYLKFRKASPLHTCVGT
jgi:hypothetical protein